MKDISESSSLGHNVVKIIITNSISLRRIITFVAGMLALILYGFSRCPDFISRWIPISEDLLTYGQYHILFSAVWLYFSIVLIIMVLSMLVCDSVKTISGRV